MRTRLTLVVAVLALAAPLSAATITGRVFIDANGDAAWQQGEETLSGAFVSDGTALVSTSSEGTYSLDTQSDTLFIVNPTGTWPAAGFWRHIGATTTSADFPLLRQEQKLPFYFLQGTDLHVKREAADLMARYVDAINSLAAPLAFIVHTGDLGVDTCRGTVEQGRALLKAYQQMVAGLKAPLLNMPGNHEQAAVMCADESKDTPGWGKGLYSELFGPHYYAFTYAGVQFIALDGTDIIDGQVAKGAIPQACMDWLEAYLKAVDPAAPIVMLMHEPIATSPQRARVVELLEGRKVLVALCGHGHSTVAFQFCGTQELMGGAVCYAWHGGPCMPNPCAYRLVKITAEGYDSALGDWAQKYPLAVDAPDWTASVTGPVTVKARVLDPGNEVQSATLSFCGQQATVTQFGTEGLYRTLEANLDPSAAADGFYDLTFTLAGNGDPMVKARRFLVLTGQKDAFTAAGPATLRMRLHEVNAENAVLFNGVELGTMAADARNGDMLEFQVPAEQLQRLNSIEIVTEKLPNRARYDDMWVDCLDMQHEGKTFADYRTAKTFQNWIRPTVSDPGRRTFYVDLTMAE